MKKIVKNSRVIISDPRSLWNNKTGVVITNNIDYTDPESEVKVKVQIKDEKFIIETFELKNLKLSDEISETLTNNFMNEYLDKANNIKDIIYPYIIVSDFDDIETESWFFINKIAIAENLDIEDVISISRQLKYPVYKIKTSTREILIVAGKHITAKMIEDDYGRYLLGFKSIERI